LQQLRGFTAQEEFETLSKAMSRGIDCTIAGEPQGLRLAFEVQCRVACQCSFADRANRLLARRHEEVVRADALQTVVNFTVWDYLRVRLDVPIPKLDNQIGPCNPLVLVDGFRIGRQIGKGATGKVYKLESPATRACSGQVLKGIPKKSSTTLMGLLHIGHEVEVMQHLEGSPHPNIVKLLQVYHSATHVSLRMENGGSQNLMKFLCANPRLSQQKTDIVLSQSIEALCHLHLEANVVHCDIKPENILVCEMATDIRIKLCDFDLSLIMRRKFRRSRTCGTFPFIAPEVIRSIAPYDPYPTDIWSLGMVAVEVLCGCQVVQDAILSPHGHHLDEQDRDQIPVDKAEIIFDYLDQPDCIQRLLHSRIRPPLRAGLDRSTVELLKGMLTGAVEERWTAKQLQERRRPR